MTIDYVAVIESESARLVAALEVDRDGRIPWSERWTVATCAKHVGGTHHVVAKVIAGSPTADFGLFASLEMPDKADPGLGLWVETGAAALTAALRSTDPQAACWSWAPERQTVGFWQRRMAHETLIHRWDAELGARVVGEAMNPTVAADGLDEYLDIFTALTRELHGASAGPSIGFHATDTGDEWLLELPAAGESVLTRDRTGGDAELSGPAEGLLLVAWGRLSPEAAGVGVAGHVVDEWTVLLPPM